jgi:3-isopropylmalate/(R)-2-methylmalate dehydratase small subunit
MAETRKTLEGTAHVFGDHIDTDVIIPARYCTSYRVEDLAPHCMEDEDPTFAERVRTGDILVAGENFGCGSSRENAPLAIRGAGIAAVVAKSYARIFYRNAINIGLPILESPEIVDATSSGDTVRIDLASGRIENVTRGTAGQASPFPPLMREIIEMGGMVPYIRSRLENRTG